MKYCRHCGKEVLDEAVLCPHCGCKIGEMEEDNANIGFIILSILIPLVGIILACVYWHKTPKAARAYLKAAIITIVIEVVLWIIIYVLIFGTIFGSIAYMFSFLE